MFDNELKIWALCFFPMLVTIISMACPFDVKDKLVLGSYENIGEKVM